MPKAARKKNKAFQGVMIKSVVAAGLPNTGKADSLRRWQEIYTAEANRFIQLLSGREMLDHIVCGSSSSSAMRQLEKESRNRTVGISCTLSQTAFDEAFTKLKNRMANIRREVIAACPGFLASSKKLFAMTVAGFSREEMMQTLQDMIRGADKPSSSWQKWISELEAMRDFDTAAAEVKFFYDCACLEYKVPVIRKAHVRLTSRNFRFGLTDKIKAEAVIEISLPDTEGYTAIPLRLSGDSARRLSQYGACNSAEYTVRDDGRLVVTVAFRKHLEEPAAGEVIGVDAGILDALHTSSDGPIGTMQDVIGFFKETVEPLKAEKTKLINKKRKLRRYIRRHRDVPADVKKSIRSKIDRLEEMIRCMRADIRAANRYHAMLKKRIKDVVAAYIQSLKGDRSVVTAMELLDIKEFNKSRKANGMMSTFARGKLSETLSETLNWRGYTFIQVEPAYTSQTCPVCSHVAKESRNGKAFTCVCCGHKDDADHVGSVNIRTRAIDKAFAWLYKPDAPFGKARRDKILATLNKKHAAWLKKNRGKKTRKAAADNNSCEARKG